MPIRPSIMALTPQIAGYRHELHQHPQLMFAETYASDLVARVLTEHGIPHTRGWAGTGIVATIDGRTTASGRTVGLRGDMDALPIEEGGVQPWKSHHAGCMHACGHDGHTATILGAALHLKQHPDFDGRVHIFFQPAEESGGGAIKMIDEGVFDKYPVDEIYAIHNAPYGPVGLFATRTGPIMACNDDVFITLTGKGGHAAMPHLAHDPIPVACTIVSALQTIISRGVDPIDHAVISITSIAAGTGTTNVIPETVTISGTVRAFRPEVRDMIEASIKQITTGIAAAHGLTADLKYDRTYEPTINEAAATRRAVAAARAVVGDEAVMDNAPPMMGAEDFGAMLMKRPGNYMWVGQATSDPTSPYNQGLHEPTYDFNDQIIPLVIEYFTTIVEQAMPLK